MDGIRKSFDPLEIEGNIHQFHHLTPTVTNLSGHGIDGANLHVRISYHSHVFSQSCSPTEVNFDFRDEQGQKRRFCPDRYQISEGLPSVCQALLSNNGYTWISNDHNRISNLAVIDGQLITGRHDIIIYYLFPSSVEGLDVEMVVKSAYNKNINFDHIRRRYKMIQQVKTCYHKKKRVP